MTLISDVLTFAMDLVTGPISNGDRRLTTCNTAMTPDHPASGFGSRDRQAFCRRPCGIPACGFYPLLSKREARCWHRSERRNMRHAWHGCRWSNPAGCGRHGPNGFGGAQQSYDRLYLHSVSVHQQEHPPYRHTSEPQAARSEVQHQVNRTTHNLDQQNLVVDPYPYLPQPVSDDAYLDPPPRYEPGNWVSGK
ncbi:hypothetical protein VTK73DRAFT_6531 [Phialemonium thermophilum]|uniref:Uncharacterized protein n=1 Tax=Phialemonium thermophilum TaxID=223376 RepID=A0ABR3XVA7_9PEZI